MSEQEMSREEGLNVVLNHSDPFPEDMDGATYRAIRIKSGWGLGELADELGVPAEMLTEIERGTRQPDGVLSSGYRRFIAGAVSAMQDARQEARGA